MTTTAAATTSAALSFVDAEDDLWQEYDMLARRAYGHPVDDIRRLGPYADRRVALRGGRVVAGGLGLLIPQWFGGRPVPAASMACGCVAPDERGEQLAARLTDARLGPLRERGAVLATLWTSSVGYVRRMGWEAPAPVFSWTVPTDDLPRRAEGMGQADIEIRLAESAEVAAVRDVLAARWNGTWQRPSWWSGWQQTRHPALSTYRFSPPGAEPAGVLSMAVQRHPVQGRQLVVHDFWAADRPTASAMLAFLGRHHSRIPTVLFERTGLPPGLLHGQPLRSATATARAWHPWLLRVLDLRRAVELRGWPTDTDLDVALDIASEDATSTTRYTLRIAGGRGELTSGGGAAQLSMSRGQFAVWYAGGYRSTAAAVLAGIDGDPAAITRLLHAVSDREPWLADYF